MSKELISEIGNSQPVSYSAIRKRLSRKNMKLRFKELRSYFATYLRQHGILAEYIDFLQGRIPKSVFARHYLKVEDVKVLVYKVLVETDNLENTLLVWFHFLPFKCFVGKDTFLLSLSFIFFSLSICLCFSNPSLLAFLLLDISIHS